MTRSTGPDTDTREKVRWRDRDRCRRCGASTWQIHHRKPRGMGGTRDPEANSPESLVLLCGSGTTGCHGWVESHRAEARAEGWLVNRHGVQRCEDVPILTQDGWMQFHPDGTATPWTEGTPHD